MANPYTTQSISGYNSSPPADDGSQTSANQLGWSKHKTKLADPIKTLAENINTAVNTAFATVDDASNLTTGTLPDARLSSNVPLKNANNTFTSGVQTISAAVPTLDLNETDAAANNRLWRYRANSESLTVQVRNDADSDGNIAVQIDRNLITVDSIALSATNITANGDEVLTEGVVAALTAIEGNDLASTDGFYVDDAGVAKRMAYSDSGIPVLSRSGATDTLATSDINRYVRYTNAGAVSVTLNSGVGKAGNMILIEQAGTGQVTVGGTATVNAAIGKKTRTRRSVIALLCTSANTWTLFGDASA